MIKISDIHYLLCRGDKCHNLRVYFNYLPYTPAKMPSIRDDVGSPEEGHEVKLVKVLLRPAFSWHIAGEKHKRDVLSLLMDSEIESIEDHCLEYGARNWKDYDDPS